jgi:hypothetical protein
MLGIVTGVRVLALLLGLLSLEAIAQEDARKQRFEFVKSNGRSKVLRYGRSIELHLKDSLPLEGNITRKHIASGVLISTTSDSIKINIWEEEWSETEKAIHPNMSYPVPVRWRGFRSTIRDTLEVPKAYAIDRIDHVSYQTNLAGVGTGITVVSALGLLVYAPLKAMKFKDGTFDGDKYIQVATPCLIGVGVGLVMMPFTEGERRVLRDC